MITVYVGHSCIGRCLTSTQQYNHISKPAVGNRDIDDLRQNSPALFPPKYYVHYLGNPEVMNKIGAETTYQECANAPSQLFVKTGDVCRLFLDA